MNLNKLLVKQLFVEELINEQLQIASKKMQQANFDFSQFSNPAKQDVNVPEWMADRETQKITTAKDIVDFSVGDGQLIISFLKTHTVNSITICDSKLINLHTTASRIKKHDQTIEVISILYTDISDLGRKIMNTKPAPSFDCVLTNPPFQGKGNPLHLQFLSMAYNLSSRYVLFVQPSTYLVDQKKENEYYQDTRNLIKDHLVSTTLYTKDIFDNAQLNTGVAAIIVDKSSTVNSYDVEYYNLKKVVTYDSIEEINNFASKDIFHSIKKKVLAAAKKRNIFNDVESTGDFCVPIPKLQRYRFLPARATVVLSKDYTDDHAAYYASQDLADAAFNHLKTPLAILALHIYKLDMNLASGRNMRSVPSFTTVKEFKDAENVIGLTQDEKDWCANIYKNSTDYIKFS
jgi:predicted RNA methylase